MSETVPPHAVPTRGYVIVFGALLGLTVVSFAANEMVRNQLLSVEASFAVILSVAVVKATLVGLFFMHLRSDWGRLFMLIVPALILGPLLILVLFPDMVLPAGRIEVP